MFIISGEPVGNNGVCFRRCVLSYDDFARQGIISVDWNRGELDHVGDSEIYLFNDRWRSPPIMQRVGGGKLSKEIHSIGDTRQCRSHSIPDGLQRCEEQIGSLQPSQSTLGDHCASMGTTRDSRHGARLSLHDAGLIISSPFEIPHCIGGGRCGAGIQASGSNQLLHVASLPPTDQYQSQSRSEQGQRKQREKDGSNSNNKVVVSLSPIDNRSDEIRQEDPRLADLAYFFGGILLLLMAAAYGWMLIQLRPNRDDKRKRNYSKADKTLPPHTTTRPRCSPVRDQSPSSSPERTLPRMFRD